jgi:hypothetical protein
MHAWGHERLAAEEQSTYSQAAFELVVDATEGCGRAPDDKLRLVPHVTASFAALTRASDKMTRTTETEINKIESIGGSTLSSTKAFDSAPASSRDFCT